MPKNSVKKRDKRSWRKKKDITGTQEEEDEETSKKKDFEDDKRIGKLSRKGTSQKEQDELSNLFTVDTKGDESKRPKARQDKGPLDRRKRRDEARARLFPAKAPRLTPTASEWMKAEKIGHQKEHRQEPAPLEPKIFDVWQGKLQSEIWKEETEKGMILSKLRSRATHGLIKPEGIGEKWSEAPAVQVPHAGQSINPEPGAFEEIACEAAARHLEQEHREEEVNHRTMFPMTAQLNDFYGEEAVKAMDDEEKLAKFREMSCPSLAGAAEPEEDGKCYAGKSHKWKQKSASFRRKEKRRTIENQKMKVKKEVQKSMKDVENIDEVLKDIEEEEEFFQQRRDYRAARRENGLRQERRTGKVFRKTAIGKVAMKELSIEVADEVGRGDMRGIKRKDNPIHERLHSLIRRGLTAPVPELDEAQYHLRKDRFTVRKYKKPGSGNRWQRGDHLSVGGA